MKNAKNQVNKSIISTNQLNDLSDLIRIENEIQKDRILFLKTDRFFEKYETDLVTLKNTIEKLRDICVRRGGNIARVGEDILVLTPNNTFSFE